MLQVRKSDKARSGRGKSFRRTFMVAAAAASAVVLAAPSASAVSYTYTYGGEGSATWFSDGDTLTICDYEPDGASVVVYADFTDTKKWHTAGAGKCTDRSYGNLTEGFDFSLRVCLGDYSENLTYWGTCSDWFRVEA
ncbi:hypothetical protein ABT033_09430 [Streptomyces pharetrae]|uniref:hypothetical protein n=1 Tax=Streptomyces pharetrae TaxID=291370 RepID=UPI003356601D